VDNAIINSRLVIVDALLKIKFEIFIIKALIIDSGGEVVGVACLVDRSMTKPKLGVPICSLLSLQVETFSAGAIPEDLQKIPAIKPGSR